MKIDGYKTADIETEMEITPTNPQPEKLLKRIDQLCAAYLNLTEATDYDSKLEAAETVITQIAEMVVVELVAIENSKGLTLDEYLKKFPIQPPVQKGFA